MTERIAHHSPKIDDARRERASSPEKTGFTEAFSAFANSAPKSVVLCLLKEGGPIGETKMHEDFSEVAGQESWAPPSRGTVRDFLETLTRAGLAERNEGKYTPTPLGIRCWPVAAKLIEQSYVIDISQLEMYGQASNGRGDTRAPANRADILSLVAESGNKGISTQELRYKLGLDGPVVNNHLRAMSDLGFVDYSGGENPAMAGITTFGIYVTGGIINPAREIIAGRRSADMWSDIPWQAFAPQGLQKHYAETRHIETLKPAEVDAMVLGAIRYLERQNVNATLQIIKATIGGRHPYESLRRMTDSGITLAEKIAGNGNSNVFRINSTPTTAA